MNKCESMKGNEEGMTWFLTGTRQVESKSEAEFHTRVHGQAPQPNFTRPWGLLVEENYLMFAKALKESIYYIIVTVAIITIILWT